MISITLKSQEKNICKKVHSFHHYLTWFLAPISTFTPSCATPYMNYVALNPKPITYLEKKGLVCKGKTDFSILGHKYWRTTIVTLLYCKI
jgi:hypothetical protein